MKKLLLLALGSLLLMIYISYLSMFQILPVHQGLEAKNPPGYYDYRGSSHVHSILSTGSGTPAEIVQMARAARQDFIFIMEVNAPRRPVEMEGYHGPVMVLTGGEYSYLDARLLYYNPVSDMPPERLGESQVFFTDLMSQPTTSAERGFAVLAHPFLRGYRYSGQIPDGLRGIEVLNLKRMLESSWQNSKWRTVFAFLTYPFNPKVGFLLLFENPRDELQLWDQLNASRPTIGFFGSDATAKAILFGDTALKIPSYESIFQLASNHVLLRSELTGNFKSDRQKILNALYGGQFYFSLDLLANPKGFFAELTHRGTRYPLGSQVEIQEGLQLVVELPNKPDVPFETVILRDGQTEMVSNSVRTSVAIKIPGTYRVMVRLIPDFPLPFGKKWMPWIYTNPIYVREGKNRK